MFGRKKLRFLAAWLVICAMLVGTLASCDLSSLGLGGMMQNGNYVEDEDDDRGSNKDKNNRPSKDEDETTMEESTKRPNNWFDDDDDDHWGVESSIECETERVEDKYDAHYGHELWEEKLEEECYIGYLDGEYVHRYVYVQGCYDCGIHISKTINNHVYSDARAIDQIRHEYERYDCDEYGNFIQTDKSIEYYSFEESPYLNGRSYSYTSLLEWFDFDELGNEIGYSSSEFVYSGDGCECIEIYTDSNGDSYRQSVGVRHPELKEKYSLKNPGGSCVDGVIATSLCPRCGYEENKYELDKEHFFSDVNVGSEVVLFYDHGHSCSGRIELAVCACGEQTNIGCSYDAECVRSYSETVDGIEHNYYTYRCYGNCNSGFVVESWRIKDAECNAVICTNYTFDDGYTYSSQVTESKYHNIVYEGLMGESSYVDNLDGTYTVTEARLEKCEDCGEYISKLIDICKKRQDGLEIFRAEYVYCFRDGNANDSYLSSESVREYGVSYNEFDHETLRNYPMSTLYRCYDEEGNVTEYCEEYYTYVGTGHCNASVQCKRLGVEDEYFTTQNHLDGVRRISLIEGADDCTDGIMISWYCGDCGQSLGSDIEYGNHHVEITEKVDLGDLGAACGGSFTVSKCLCGECVEYGFDTNCNFEHVTGISIDRDDNGMADMDKSLYRCTKCNFAYVECYEFNEDESCVQTITHSINFGVSNIDDGGLYSVSYSTINDYLAHYTEYYELNVGNRVVGEERCKVCGKLVREQVRENFIITNTRYNYYKNGGVASVEVEEQYAFYADNGGLYQTVIKRTYYENYNENGDLDSWQEYLWSYSGDENNSYCGHYTVIYKSSDHPEGYVCEEGDRHEWYSLSNDWECVPGANVLEAYCIYCGEVRYSEYASHGGHSYKYNSTTGMYECDRCNVVANEEIYGERLMISCVTDGAYGEYFLIRYYDNWGSDAWNINLYLVLPNGSEVAINSSCVIITGDRWLQVDANSVAQLAASYGYGCCDYLIKAEAVNYNDGDVYSAYIDGHVYSLSQVTGSGCYDERVEIYGCTMCGSYNIYENREYTGHYYRVSVQVEISYDSSGNRITRKTITNYCESCGYYETYETVQKHTHWGECIESSEQ